MSNIHEIVRAMNERQRPSAESWVNRALSDTLGSDGTISQLNLQETLAVVRTLLRYEGFVHPRKTAEVAYAMTRTPQEFLRELAGIGVNVTHAGQLSRKLIRMRGEQP